MDGFGTVTLLLLRTLDIVARLSEVLWIMVKGIPGVLRYGVGFWNKDKDKADDRARPHS